MVNLRDIRETIVAGLADEGTLPAHVSAFGAWARADAQALRVLVDQAVSGKGQQRHPEHVAAMGFAAHMQILSVLETELLRDDLEQLAGRSYFAPGRPPRFEIDGIALLGVALGLRSATPNGQWQWLQGLLDRATAEVASDAWQVGVMNGAQRALNIATGSVTPSDLDLVFACRGLGEIAKVNRGTAWTECSTFLRASAIPGRDAVRLVAFDELVERRRQIVPRAATRSDLIDILRGVSSRSMRKWTYEDKGRTGKGSGIKWEIDNEYHVQNLLWATLAPLFPDLEDEEQMPSFGHKHPRADLGIPSLRTIVEVKFMRQATQAALAGIIEEIAADTSLYLSKPTVYDGIITFVWDDKAQTEQHHELQMGLEQLNGIVAAIIMPRPQRMERR